MHTIDATYQTEFSFLSYLFVRVNGEMRIMKEKRKEENEILILFLLLFVVGWAAPFCVLLGYAHNASPNGGVCVSTWHGMQIPWGGKQEQVRLSGQGDK